HLHHPAHLLNRKLILMGFYKPESFRSPLEKMPTAFFRLSLSWVISRQALRSLRFSPSRSPEAAFTGARGWAEAAVNRRSRPHVDRSDGSTSISSAAALVLPFA